MARTTVQFRNLKQVQKNFRKLGREGQQAFRGAMYAEGLHIADKAAQKAPSVTGRLRNSHFVSWPDFRDRITVGFGVVYAASVEYGLKLVNASRRQQKAAFANMGESGWKKSPTGGPGFFRNAIRRTSGGRVNRIAKTAKRLFKRRQGFIPMPGEPRSAREARDKSNT